jgi:hypothetical protein
VWCEEGVCFGQCGSSTGGLVFREFYVGSEQREKLGRAFFFSLTCEKLIDLPDRITHP